MASTKILSNTDLGNSLSSSGFDIGSSEEKESTREVGRISNALSSNIAAPKQLDLFDSLGEKAKEQIMISDKAHYVDRRGKAISLSVEDIQLIKALSSYLPFNDPEIKTFVSNVSTMDAHGNTRDKIISPVQIPVSVLQLCKDIIGDTKEASIKKMGERLQRLEEVEQVQTFITANKEKYKVVRPLIRFGDKIFKCYSEIRSSKGRRKNTSKEKEQQLLVGANVIYSSLFLYEATNKYCPLYIDKLFAIWRHNRKEVFAILLSDLESKWRQYYINYVKAETEAGKEYKELKATNKPEYYKKLAEAKKLALVYKSSTITIRDRLTTDYKTTRKMQAQFIPDLQRAIDSLVEYGIIASTSHITKDNALVVFVYNPKFVPDKADLLLPD